ncbi:MAG: hypothetical protein UZ15_CFX003002352 [Chloroflexi bacterium OLB15]|nr:MAG: hypothetical protein UZ15_CFX003002352 [Chloroflexi bacterium OLB15]
MGIGYEVICSNWRCPGGEIDIVAKDGEFTVIVEVRTRRGSSTEWAWASITPRKRAILEAAAFQYMDAQGDDSAWRIDVVAIALPPRGKPIIEHAQDALNW